MNIHDEHGHAWAWRYKCEQDQLLIVFSVTSLRWLDKILSSTAVRCVWDVLFYTSSFYSRWRNREVAFTITRNHNNAYMVLCNRTAKFQNESQISTFQLSSRLLSGYLNSLTTACCLDVQQARVNITAGGPRSAQFVAHESLRLHIHRGDEKYW